MKKALKGIVAGLLACLMLFAFTGCVPKNFRKAEENLIDKGYDVEVYTDSDEVAWSLITAGVNTVAKEYIDPNSVETFLVAKKGSLMLVVIYCESSDAAKDLKDRVDEIERDLADAYDYEKDEYKIAKQGKVVYFGHKISIKAV